MANSFYLRFCFFLYLVLFSAEIGAQELPPVEFFDSKEYGAENQNWSISQSEEGYIYIANNKGLLEFNGAKWQLYHIQITVPPMQKPPLSIINKYPCS